MAQLGQPCWIDITVTSADDRERLVAFLCDLFDWTHEASGPEVGYYTMLRRDGVDVAAVGQQANGSARWMTFLHADDIEAAAASVRDHGGTVESGPHTVMRAGTLATCLDPVGAAFGLWQPDLFGGFPETVAPGYPEWFHHGSQEPGTAVDFYGAAFDLLTVSDEDDTMLGRDGRGYFTLGRNIAGNPADFKPVILVEDLDALESRITRLDGEIYASCIEVPGGFATTFADPVVKAPLIIATNST
ncbi:MAG: VOC family protein [Actinomycetales bacterium]|nr:VOC family protein [Actinomycetales bacterium]